YHATQAGTARLTATAGNLTATGQVTITPARAAKLVFTGLPSGNISAGDPFDVDVAVEDAFDNQVTSYTGAVTLGLASNVALFGGPGGLTEAAADGVAHFSGVNIHSAGISYILTASANSPTVAGARAATGFTIVAAAPDSIAVTSGSGQMAFTTTPF